MEEREGGARRREFNADRREKFVFIIVDREGGGKLHYFALLWEI